MIRIKKLLGLASVATVLLFTSCEKDFDSPPIRELGVGNIITIADLKAMRVANGNVDLKITDELSLYAVVTMDEQTGNIFKESYIQDATGAINIRLSSSGGLYQGDSIRVYLKGTVISEFSQMVQLDSVDVDNNIIKQATGHDRVPELVADLSQITAGHQSKLIRLENVQFSTADLGQTYADGTNQEAKNHMLIDASGVKFIVRTSGFANFADDIIPSLNGSIIGIVSQFNSDLQLLIRNPNELNFTNPRIAEPKDFEDLSLTSGGWTTQVVVGSFNWQVDNFSGNNFASISNFNAGNTASEAWYISPAFDFSASTIPTLSFQNTFNFSGAPLEVLVSTDYDGTSAPATATWTPVTVNLSTGGFNWVNSGVVDLSAFLGLNTYIAFKYTGTNFDGSTWEIDDIIINK